MKRLRQLQIVWLIIAAVPVGLAMLNLIVPVPLAARKEAAIPLALCIGLGIANAMLLEKNIKKQKS